MSLVDVIAERFARLRKPTPKQLRQALVDVSADEHTLEPHLGEPGVYPYGRMPLFVSDDVEVIAMNWATGRKCSPHDHGESFGWIQVVCGGLSHVLYTLDKDDRPVEFASRYEASGTVMFSARGAVHSMGNPGKCKMVTLHAYAPPIDGMTVYDLERCARCVVSNDCGAWWPAEQRQLLRIIKTGDTQERDRKAVSG
jgi:cysteine dioxygenase